MSTAQPMTFSHAKTKRKNLDTFGFSENRKKNHSGPKNTYIFLFHFNRALSTTANNRNSPQKLYLSIFGSNIFLRCDHMKWMMQITMKMRCDKKKIAEAAVESERWFLLRKWPHEICPEICVFFIPSILLLHRFSRWGPHHTA